MKELNDNINKNNFVVLVNGIGGIGKTEVCKKYLNDNIDSYKHVAWITYNSSIKESFVNQFDDEIIKYKSDDDTLDKKYERVKKFLTNLDTNSLLIVDNIENNKDKNIGDLRSFLFKVIVSSRMKIDNFKEIDINTLDIENCKKIFNKYYTIEENDEFVNKIIKLAGKHTLTIELLAKTVQESRMELEEFYEILLKEKFNLKDITPKVSTQWHETNEDKLFEQILKVFKISNLNSLEVFILGNLSVLPYVELSCNDIIRWLNLDKKSVEAITSLIKKGWIKERADNTIIMHNVIQEAVKEQTKPSSKGCSKLIINLAEDLEVNSTESFIPKLKYIEFGKSVLENFKNDVENLNIASLANNISLIYQYKGEYEEALKYGKKAIEINEKVLSTDHPYLAASYNNISVIYQYKGEYEEALKYVKKAIEIREKVLSADDPYLAA